MAGIADGGKDFEAVSNDTRVGEQAVDVTLLVRGNPLRVEIVERLAKVFAFVEDDGPAYAGLEAIEEKELEELTVVVDGDAPFGVVVFDHQRVGRAPRAALDRHVIDSGYDGIATS